MFDLTKNLKDASYVLIGLGVIGYQKASEQGKQLTARLSDQRVQLDKQVEETKTQLTKVASDIEQRFAPVREAVEGRLDTLQERLPEVAKELVSQTREAAVQAQTNLRTRFNGASAAA
jgi:ElaB/YqjD/DUF883 family membrane-anchored ribosome-binding protein